MREKSIRIRLSQTETDRLNQLIEEEGCGLSEFIRRLISRRYEKEHPAYGKGKKTPKIVIDPGPKLTPEQQCEAMGGKVILENFVRVCETPDGYGKLTTPLTDPMFNK